jgi:hypothetical protein
MSIIPPTYASYGTYIRWYIGKNPSSKGGAYKLCQLFTCGKEKAP